MEIMTRHLSDFDGFDIISVDTETFDYDEEINRLRLKEYEKEKNKAIKQAQKQLGKGLFDYTTVDEYVENVVQYPEIIPLKEKYTVDIFSVCGKKGSKYIYGTFDGVHFLDFMKSSLHKKIIMHNAPYDLKVMKRAGLNIDLVYVEDTMVMARLLENPKWGYGLKDLRVSMLKKESRDKFVDVDKSDKEAYFKYAGLDALDTYQLYELFTKRIEREDLTEHYRLECEAMLPIIEAEYYGHPIDLETLSNIKGEVLEVLQPVQLELNELIGTINLNSPMQLKKLFFEELGVGCNPKWFTDSAQKKIPRGVKDLSPYLIASNMGTDKGMLKTVSKQHDKAGRVAQLLLQHRKFSKLLTTYIDAFIEDSKDSRIFGRYDQLGCVTSRLSSKSPNMQNISGKDMFEDDDSSNIRDVFVPSYGRLITTADYSQQELRMMAELSKDPNMMKAFLDDIDIHQQTANLLGLTGPKARSAAKAVNFAIGYGISAIGLKDWLEGEGVFESLEYAQSLIDGFWSAYPRVRAMFEYTWAESRKIGYVRTISGFKARLTHERAAGDRQAGSGLIQGSSAAQTKIAMVRVYKNKDHNKSRFLSFVHDEMSLDHDEDYTDELRELVTWGMEKAIDTAVPFKVGIKTSKRWSDNK